MIDSIKYLDTIDALNWIKVRFSSNLDSSCVITASITSVCDRTYVYISN